ncbi:MAG: hypothetical protein M1167_04625 [Chloroflexi bacterium]|nr:hypothetical protein [Chloroflexota bacterium]
MAVSFGIALKREEAISVLKELLDSCRGLDGHILQLGPPAASSTVGGYQIIIKLALDQETQNCILDILGKHKLAYQAGSFWKTKRSINKTEPDTFIIYKPKK